MKIKRVLITGSTGYIAGKLHTALNAQPEKYRAELLSLRGDDWKIMDFSGWDVVIHTAGIAHRKETEENAPEYYQINRDLALAVAEKAQHDGVGQFIFFSSMSVYGVNTGVIRRDTAAAPVSAYGKSKLQAEQQLAALEQPSFRVCVVRPPMVYGEGCRGNYVLLGKFARKSPIFPKYQNSRSMVSIDRLTEEILALVDSNAAGLYFPRDEKDTVTCEMVASLAEQSGHRIRLTRIFNPGIALALKLRVPVIEKVFGTLIYDIPEES